MNELDLHCAAQTARLGESPAGTAGAADLILLLQLPLPWPNKIDAHPALSGFTPPTTSGRRVQILAIAPRAGDSGDPCHIIGYHTPPGEPFGHFERFELTAAPDTWLETVKQLSEGQLPASEETVLCQETDCKFTGQQSETPPEKHPVIDLLICTHGSRDRCCGQSGTLLFIDVEEAVRTSEDLSHLQVWRTSHIGGHRFAPTALTLPDGMTWASLDSDCTFGILRRSLDAKQAGQHLRGNVGLPGGPAQIADGLAFGEIGWDWLDYDRQPNVTTIPIDGFGLTDTRSESAGRARRDDQPGSKTRSSSPTQSIKTATVSSQIGSITVVLKPAPALPVPPCGDPLDQATKSVAQWEITSAQLTRLSP